MEAPHLERKLVAILAADIEGFSRHMERDETGTLEVLSKHRLIVDAAIGEYRGRITSTAGDSVLAEFASVLSAMNCAVQIQQALAEENAKLDEGHRLFFRMGINVGDVMMKDGDIFGDGVNIAARLESLAEAGGICVSRGVRDHLRKHRIVVFEDLGEQKVKNIAQPVRAFKVRIGDSRGDNPPSEGLGDDGTPNLEAPTLENIEVELAFWETIKDSGSPEELEAYLARYPDGAFVVLARARHDALIARSEAEPSAEKSENDLSVEHAFWDAAKDSHSRVELEAYVDRYPDGEFIELAKARIQSIDKFEETSASTAPKVEISEGEIAFWNSIKDKGDPDMFRAYINKFPTGAYVELAQINIGAQGR